ncbi:GSCFA domain-containing protein [uncultured Kriegella sp.]|uniref:GSCFA domain-containing protein n=1 Tax=uncultured Kriegella sp. TaxID=1798910 RepID=UPI0030DD8A58|tara:strand:+ start:17873 stop:18832 length:960 start_codon:yes stop_codon:yes gene_type:complete
MKLQTQIPLKPEKNQISYDSELLLIGSCFAQHLGRKLDYFKFRNIQNPFGILFHPLSIENLVSRAVRDVLYTEDEVFFHNERWHCFDSHSDLSDASEEKLVKKLNLRLKITKEQIAKTTHVVITLGTAWAYRHVEKRAFVANCHKVPQKKFTKELLSVHEIATSIENTMQHARAINPNTNFIFTVSPVRHLKDGFVENQRSKAHLIAALHEVLEKSIAQNVCERYFPSYELMMDELRDYRFYKADMIHPNELAIDYIWEKFKSICIVQSAYPTMDKVDVVKKGRSHRPFNAASEEHKKFEKGLEAKVRDLRQAYPFMTF